MTQHLERKLLCEYTRETFLLGNFRFEFTLCNIVHESTKNNQNLLEKAHIEWKPNLGVRVNKAATALYTYKRMMGPNED